MADINRSVVENARALELYLRLFPETASFLHYFKRDEKNPTQLGFYYEGPDDGKFSAAELDFENQMQLFLTSVSKALGRRIDVDSPLPEDLDKIQILHSIMLDDPRLKNVILDLTVRLINAERKVKPDFTLSYFPSAKEIGINPAIPKDYEGLKDEESLQALLSKPFTHDVTLEEMEELAAKMNVLASKFLPRARSQEGGDASGRGR